MEWHTVEGIGQGTGKEHTRLTIPELRYTRHTW